MSNLSRSTKTIFVLDLLIFIGVTTLVLKYSLNNSCSLFVQIFIIALITFAGIISLSLKGQYKLREHNISIWNFYRLFEGVIFAHVPALSLLIWAEKMPTLKFLVINVILIYILLCLSRLCYHFYLFYFKAVQRVLIIGVNERARIIADEIKSKYILKMNVVGFIQTDSNGEEFINDDKTPVYEDINELREVIKKNKINIVVITEPTEAILKIPRGVKIYKMPEFYEMVTGKFYIDEKTITELYYQYMKHQSLSYDFRKRAYDIIAAIIILTVTLPITAYIAIRVKLTDGGSPFFTQTRVGKDGKTFECYKLRTMYINDYVPKNYEDVKYAESVKSDDRIIPFCKFVRKARFDEIPQMINVLKGEMSIVGPRAEWKDEVEIFKRNIPYYSDRMWVKTGWTGWSHINMNPVFTVDEECERLAYDLYYIKHRNILWEVGILIKAVFLALGGRHK